MLVRFTVRNYLSFRDEVVFDLFPTGLQTLQDHIISDNTGKKVQSLPISLIYGANASGKSNLLEALRFVREFVRWGTEMNRPICVTPFLLDPTTKDEPSRFELVFKTRGVVYTYGFVVSRDAVLEEWLFAYFSKSEERIYERKLENGKTLFHFGRRLKKREFGRADAYVKNNTLFVTFAHEKNEILETVYRWFCDSLFVLPAGANFDHVAKFLHRNPKVKEFVSDKLKETDIGIESIDIKEIKKEKQDKDRFLKNVFPPLNLDAIEQITIHPMFVKHRDSVGNVIMMPLQVESDGTKRMIELLPLFDIKDAGEKIVFIDEIDRSLHPLLSRWILENCIAIAKAKKGESCQFVFTTHDTNLLDRRLLRRDEIWFIEKDTGGCSHLSRLSEFKVNEGLNYENGYLNGRFGAIPFPVLSEE